MKKKFFDCFDRELKEGDDILYVKNEVVEVTSKGFIIQQPVIRCAIVNTINDNGINIIVQKWEDNKEIDYSVTISALKEITKLLYVYKIRNHG